MNLMLSCFLFLLIMTFGEPLNEFSDQQKRTVRWIESTQKKIVNAKLAVVFNKECLKNNILPKFTYIYIYIYINIYIYIYIYIYLVTHHLHQQYPYHIYCVGTLPAYTLHNW